MAILDRGKRRRKEPKPPKIMSYDEDENTHAYITPPDSDSGGGPRPSLAGPGPAATQDGWLNTERPTFNFVVPAPGAAVPEVFMRTPSNSPPGSNPTGPVYEGEVDMERPASNSPKSSNVDMKSVPTTSPKSSDVDMDIAYSNTSSTVVDPFAAFRRYSLMDVGYERPQPPIDVNSVVLPPPNTPITSYFPQIAFSNLIPQVSETDNYPYYDYSKQQPGEPIEQAKHRVDRAAVAMGLERKPEFQILTRGNRETDEQWATRLENRALAYEKSQALHQARMRPFSELYDRQYAENWAKDKARRRAFNDQRRAEALEYRKEYDRKVQRFTVVPLDDPYDSGDDHYANYPYTRASIFAASPYKRQPPPGFPKLGYIPKPGNFPRGIRTDPPSDRCEVCELNNVKGCDLRERGWYPCTSCGEAGKEGQCVNGKGRLGSKGQTQQGVRQHAGGRQNRGAASGASMGGASTGRTTRSGRAFGAGAGGGSGGLGGSGGSGGAGGPPGGFGRGPPGGEDAPDFEPNSDDEDDDDFEDDDEDGAAQPNDYVKPKKRKAGKKASTGRQVQTGSGPSAPLKNFGKGLPIIQLGYMPGRRGFPEDKRTNPHSDMCKPCFESKKSMCDLFYTGYPCSKCIDRDIPDECVNYVGHKTGGPARNIKQLIEEEARRQGLPIPGRGAFATPGTVLNQRGITAAYNTIKAGKAQQLKQSRLERGEATTAERIAGAKKRGDANEAAGFARNRHITQPGSYATFRNLTRGRQNNPDVAAAGGNGDVGPRERTRSSSPLREGRAPCSHCRRAGVDCGSLAPCTRCRINGLQCDKSNTSISYRVRDEDEEEEDYDWFAGEGDPSELPPHHQEMFGVSSLDTGSDAPYPPGRIGRSPDLANDMIGPLTLPPMVEGPGPITPMAPRSDWHIGGNSNIEALNAFPFVTTIDPQRISAQAPANIPPVLPSSPNTLALAHGQRLNLSRMSPNLTLTAHRSEYEAMQNISRLGRNEPILVEDTDMFSAATWHEELYRESLVRGPNSNPNSPSFIPQSPEFHMSDFLTRTAIVDNMPMTAIALFNWEDPGGRRQGPEMNPMTDNGLALRYGYDEADLGMFGDEPHGCDQVRDICKDAEYDNWQRNAFNCKKNPIKFCDIQIDMDKHRNCICIDCHSQQQQFFARVYSQIENGLKLHLCHGCVPKISDLNFISNGRCKCFATLKAAWLCHDHVENIAHKYEHGIGAVDQWLAGTFPEQYVASSGEFPCVLCGRNEANGDNKVWACKICRNWVDRR